MKTVEDIYLSLRNNIHELENIKVCKVLYGKLFVRATSGCLVTELHLVAAVVKVRQSDDSVV